MSEIRIRRMRIKPHKLEPLPKEKQRMEELLKSIAKIDHEVEIAAENRKEYMAELLKLMKVYKLDRLAIDKAVAEMITPMGRSSSRIDPQQFYDLVDEDDFFAAVNVVKERAEKLLGEKELASITDVTPGKQGDPTLKITRR